MIDLEKCSFGYYDPFEMGILRCFKVTGTFQKMEGACHPKKEQILGVICSPFFDGVKKGCFEIWTFRLLG